MTIEEQKAKEYCEKNIPSMPEMHLTISTAFEAGWESCLEHLRSIPSTEILGELYRIKRHGQFSKDHKYRIH